MKITDLTPEQNEAIDRLFEYDETLLIAQVGFGKAVVALTAIDDLLATGALRRVLVLAPLKVCELTWGCEAEKWAHIEATVAVATGNAAERSAAFESDAKIVVCNFDNTPWVIENYGDQFDGVVFDEMSKLKTVSGTSFKKLRSWVGRLTWRVGMSATPVAERGIDIYGQALLLDLGKALGTRRMGFLNKYFYPMDYEQRKWGPLPHGPRTIAKKLAGLVYMADDSGYTDSLPHLSTELIHVSMSSTGRQMYDQMKTDNVIDLLEPPVVADSAAVAHGKMFQLAAGGLYDNEGELVYLSTHKLQRCRDIIDNRKDPIILVYQYRFERDFLTQHYPDALVLGGGAAFTPAMQDEWNEGKHKLLILHPKSAAAGLNLQMATDTMVFISPLASADAWKQTVGRIRRRGSPFKNINRIVLMAKNTIDYTVISNMADKNEAESDFMKELGDVC